MNEDINELFGDLRSLFAGGDYEPRELYWLLCEAQAGEPDQYRDQWHHYLRHYGPLRLLITSIDEVHRLPDLLPEDQLQDVTLRMTGHHLRKWHFQELADSQGAWFVRELDISDNKAQNHYPTPFAHSETLVNVRVLNMARCGLHNMVATWILDSKFMASVEDLDLEGNPLEHNDIKVMMASEHIRGLRRLNLNACHIDRMALQALIESPNLPALTALSLEGNPLNAEAFEALSTWPGLANLEQLHMPWDVLAANLDVRQRFIDSRYLNETLKDEIFEASLPKQRNTK